MFLIPKRAYNSDWMGEQPDWMGELSQCASLRTSELCEEDVYLMVDGRILLGLEQRKGACRRANEENGAFQLVFMP